MILKNIYFFKFLFIPLIIFSFQFSISYSKNNHEIIAKVNNEIISSNDLDEKVGFFRYILQIDENLVLNPIFKKFALIKLIEDKLMYQEINKIDSSLLQRSNDVSEKLIIQRSGLSKEDLIKELNKFGFKFDSFVKFYSIKIAFNSIINSKYKQRFERINTQSSEYLENITQNKQYFSYSEIVLKPNIFFSESDNKILSNLIHKLILEEISFSNLSELFSSSDSKLNKGEKLWVLLDEINAEFVNNLDKLKYGEISKPFKIGNDFFIIQNNGKINDVAKDKNEYIYLLGRLYVKLVETYSDNEIKRIKDLLTKNLEKTVNCESLSKLNKIFKINSEYQEFELPFIKIPKEIQKYIINLKINEFSPILNSTNGFVVLIVCNKSYPDKKFPSEKDAASIQKNELLNKISNQYLTSLARKAKIIIN